MLQASAARQVKARNLASGRIHAHASQFTSMRWCSQLQQRGGLRGSAPEGHGRRPAADQDLGAGGGPVQL